MNKFFTLWKKFGMIALLVILFVIFAVARPDTFLTSTTMLNILKQASVTGVLSCGVTLMLITGDIDLSVASRMAVITLIVSTLLLNGVPLVVAVLAGVLFAVASGVLNAVLSEVLSTSMFIVTTAINYVWTGVCYLTVGATIVYGLPDSLKNIAQYDIFGAIPSIIPIFLVCAVIATFLLSKTYFGRHLYALGGNREAARACGINLKKYTIYAFLLSGVFVGMSGMLYASRVNAGMPSGAQGYEGQGIAATVIGGIGFAGGTGSAWGAIVGAIVLGIITNILNLLGVDSYVQQIVNGLVIVFAVGLDTFTRGLRTSQ